MATILEFKKPVNTKKEEKKVDKENVFEDNIKKNKELEEKRKQETIKANKRVLHDYRINK